MVIKISMTMLFLVGVTILIFSLLNLWIWKRDINRATEEEWISEMDWIDVRKHLIWGVIGLAITSITQIVMIFY